MTPDTAVKIACVTVAKQIAAITDSPEGIEALRKDWSEKAREAAAEARRHGSAADDHRSKADAARKAGDKKTANAHDAAAAAHGDAANKYTQTATKYGRSKWHSAGVGALVGSTVLGVGAVPGAAIGLGARAIGQRRRMSAARGLGARADKLSAQFA